MVLFAAKNHWVTGHKYIQDYYGVQILSSNILALQWVFEVLAANLKWFQNYSMIIFDAFSFRKLASHLPLSFPVSKFSACIKEMTNAEKSKKISQQGKELCGQNESNICCFIYPACDVLSCNCWYVSINLNTCVKQKSRFINQRSWLNLKN